MPALCYFMLERTAMICALQRRAQNVGTYGWMYNQEVFCFFLSELGHFGQQQKKTSSLGELR